MPKILLVENDDEIEVYIEGRSDKLLSLSSLDAKRLGELLASSTVKEVVDMAERLLAGETEYINGEIQTDGFPFDGSEFPPK